MGYGDFYKNSDTVIIGNKTYQQIHTLAVRPAMSFQEVRKGKKNMWSL
ncbi:hypothetical protein ABIE66_003975 [Peribacillus sp. B2I2]